MAALFTVALVAGCGESSAHSVASDYRYYETDRVILLVDRQHFGGGQDLSPTRVSFPYGFDLTNASRFANAERVRLRLRIFAQNGRAEDDHVFDFGDLKPGETRRVEGTVEAPRLYSGSEATLIWQSGDRTFSADIKQGVYRLEDIKPGEY